MREPVDTSIERLLAETLTERAARVPATVTLERVHARLEERQAARRRRSARRPFALLGIAAAVLLPMAALIVAQRPSRPDPGDAAGYQAIVRRTEGDAWLVVAVRGDGQERVLTSVPALQGDRRHPQMAVSADGWLALPGPTGWEFRDLRSPGRAIGPITPFLESADGHAWVDGGRLATWNAAGEVQLLDPRAGTVTRASMPEPLPCETENDGCEVIAWAADGSAVVAKSWFGPSLVYSRGDRHPAGWRVLPLDRGTVAETLGDLELGWRSGTWWRDDGSRVQLCDMAVRQECPGSLNGAVVVESADGTIAPWYTDELAPDDVVDAALGSAAVWLVLDRRTDGWQTVLARVDAPGQVVEVAAWPNDLRGSAGGMVTATAQDASLVAVSASGELLVDARSGRVTRLGGTFLGFLPSATVDGWPGASFRAPDPVASPPPPPPVPTMPPLDLIVAEQLTPADRELWRGEQLAAEGPGASPTAFEIGPITFDLGVGVFLACDGPSDVMVTAETADGPGTDAIGLNPILSRCLDPRGLAGGYMPSAAVWGPVRFRVTTGSDTSWRLLIFDPAPGE